MGSGLASAAVGGIVEDRGFSVPSGLSSRLVMIELLAIPQWQAPARTLNDWSAALAGLGLDVRVVQDEDRDSWLEIPSLRSRGFAVLDGLTLEAIHFEVAAIEPEPAIEQLTQAASALGWELHPDNDEDDDENDDTD